MIAFGEALTLQTKIGRAAIEKRSRELATALVEGLRKIDGVKMWTSADPSRRAAVLSFQPAGVDPRKLATALYQKDRIGCATRGGQPTAPAFGSHHISTTRTPTSTARSRRSRDISRTVYSTTNK